MREPPPYHTLTQHHEKTHAILSVLVNLHQLDISKITMKLQVCPNSAINLSSEF